jgi:hypothetical protein
MKRGSQKRWSKTNAAYIGAFLGMVIAMAHQVHHAIGGDVPNENPLVHIFPELVGLTAGSAVLAAIVAEIRNRIRATRLRRAGAEQPR